MHTNAFSRIRMRVFSGNADDYLGEAYTIDVLKTKKATSFLDVISKANVLVFICLFLYSFTCALAETNIQYNEKAKPELYPILVVFWYHKTKQYHTF